jgi:hypothetical protein
MQMSKYQAHVYAKARVNASIIIIGKSKYVTIQASTSENARSPFDLNPTEERMRDERRCVVALMRVAVIFIKGGRIFTIRAIETSLLAPWEISPRNRFIEMTFDIAALPETETIRVQRLIVGLRA